MHSILLAVVRTVAPSRSLLVSLAALVNAVALPARGAPTSVNPIRPHVVIILVDDMGYGDPGCYNPASKIATPHIDSLARDGMRFTDAHAPGPLCHMSRYGLLTGRYPFRTDVKPWRTQPLIAENQTTIASLLKQQGYRTAMVGKWHLGFAEAGYDRPLRGGPIDVGFDSFFGIRASTDIPPYFYIRGDRAVQPPTKKIAANQSEGWSRIQGAFWRAGLIAPNLELADVLPRFTEEAIAVVKDYAAGDRTARTQEPLFLYLAYPAPHTPWLPTSEFAGKSKAGMYGDFAEMVDAMVGRVLSTLDEAQMSEETLLILTSDNGPVWYDADVERLGHDSAGGLRGMKADAWEAGHRMPFLVRWPGKVAPGSTSNQTVCFTDLMATLATITGYELKPEEGPDSVDFSKVLLGTHRADQRVRRSLVMRSGRGLMTVRQGDWKLIDGRGSGGFSGSAEEPASREEPPGQLYNLSDDPAEATNLFASRSDVVMKLQRTLASVLRTPSTRESAK